jgi:Phage integrase family
VRKPSTTKAKGKKGRPKTKLGIPDLEHSKAAVLRSLGSPDSVRGNQHAIDEFVAWYCSEPRLDFNKTVVLRYRFHLEERGLAPGTINARMAAGRRLAYEAADSGLLTLDVWLTAAGIKSDPLFRCVCWAEKPWGDGISETTVWHVVKKIAAGVNIPHLAPHDLRRSCARLCHDSGGELEQIQFLLGNDSVQTTERYIGCRQHLRVAVNDKLGIEPG